MENQKCKMISIDSSTSKTAYAVFLNGEYQYSKVINFTKLKADQAFENMSKAILNTLNEEKPDIIYIENLVVMRNMTAMRKLSMLLGVVYAYSIEHDCEYNLLRPTEWRKLVGIDQGRKKREVLKQEAVDRVSQTMALDVCDDEAEAILIGMAAINLFN